MSEALTELITYADHTQGCMVAAGHDECTCGYDDAEGKAKAAWDALKAENARLREALRKYGRHHTACSCLHRSPSRCDCGFDAALREMGLKADIV